MKGLAPETVVKILLLLLAVIILFLIFPIMLDIMMTVLSAGVRIIGCIATLGLFC